MADISVHSKFTELLDVLVEEDSESGGRPFRQFSDVVKFAAVVGVRKDIKGDPDNIGRTIPFRIFRNAKDHELIWLIALAETKDVDVLRSDEYQDNEGMAVGIFEAFANGGLEVILSWLDTKAPSEYADVILEKISEELSAEIEIEDSAIEF